MPPMRFHDIRHSAAGFLLSEGYNLREISEWLGHGDIQITVNLYAHISFEHKVAKTDKLNKRFEAFGILGDSENVIHDVIHSP